MRHLRFCTFKFLRFSATLLSFFSGSFFASLKRASQRSFPSSRPFCGIPIPAKILKCGLFLKKSELLSRKIVNRQLAPLRRDSLNCHTRLVYPEISEGLALSHLFSKIGSNLSRWLSGQPKNAKISIRKS